MAYRYEGKDIVIDGWENGIAPSPHAGIADLRSANIGSVPGQVSVNFKTAALNKPPTVTTLAFTVNTTTDVFTVASTTGWYNGMAITLDTVVTSTGISTGRVYWIGDLTATTFKLYVNPTRQAGAVVDVTGSNGSGTMSSYTLGKPIDYTEALGANLSSLTPFTNYTFILDNNGRAWTIDNFTGTPTNNLVYLGNDTLTGGSGRAIAFFKEYLIVFRSTNLDALPLVAIRASGVVDLDGGSGWIYGWESISSSDTNPRPVLVGQDDIMYYGNNERVGSISQNIDETFDPSSGTTYTENTSALDLPENVDPTALAELGVDLLVGTETTKIYPWDRISPSFRLPIIVPESGTYKIISVGSVAYIFAGSRGRIYRTTGTLVEEWKKVPDHLTGFTDPYFAWDAAVMTRNQLYFSFTPCQNDRTAITGMGGVWAIDLITEALRHVHQLSYGATGVTSLIVPNPHANDGTAPTYQPSGSGLIIGWENSASYGVDIGSSNPYSGGETIIESDIIPFGTNIFPNTPAQIEYKLSRPLVAGESIELKYRTNLTASYTSWLVSNTAGLLSESADTNFENAEWVQIQAILTSTNTTPSRVPLREIRLRQASI